MNIMSKTSTYISMYMWVHRSRIKKEKKGYFIRFNFSLKMGMYVYEKFWVGYKYKE